MSTADASAFERKCRQVGPEVFIVLGSGLGEIVQHVDIEESVPFSAIPGLPSSSVSGHKGRLTLGRWAGRPVLVAEGRVHYYEGHSWDVVARPIRWAAQLGIRMALFTNAAGGIRDDLGPGSFMPIRDHLQWNCPYPWRTPSLPSPYSPRLLEQIVSAGRSLDLVLAPGTYAAVTGPSYETRAEIRALRSVGADVVGMSTSREVLAGTEAGVECAAISLITNRAAGLSAGPLDHGEVIAEGRQAAKRLGELLEVILRA